MDYTKLAGRIIGYSVLAIAGLTVSFIVLRIIYNRFDDPLEPGAEAWLRRPPITTPDAKNGFLTMMALNSQASQPQAAAGALMREHRRIFEQGTASGKGQTYADATNRILKPEEINTKDWPRCSKDCYQEIMEHREPIQQRATKHAVLLERYNAMLDMPAFAGDVIEGVSAPAFPSQTASAISILYLAEIVNTAERGDMDTAYAQWVRYHQFWLRAAQGSNNLLGTMVSAKHIKNGLDVLEHLLASHPESKERARTLLAGPLSESQSLPKLFAQAMQAEFRFIAYGTSHIKEFDNTASLDEQLLMLNFKPRATVNIIYQNLSEVLRETGFGDAIPAARKKQTPSFSCGDSVNFLTIDNPVGKILACVAMPDFRKYQERLKATAAQAARIQQGLTSG